MSDTSPLTILRETPDWIGVDKPAPLLIHPTRPDNEPTLWQRLCKRYPGESLCLLNRLDRETSGIVLVGRHPEASSILGKKIQARQIRKNYLALVRGIPPEYGEISAPILRKAKVEEASIYVEQIVHPLGKPCQTRFRRIDTRTFNSFPVSLCDIELLTGRMHQIRVHLRHIGFPVVGDKLYGTDPRFYIQVARDGWDDSLLKDLWLRRQALHAHRMSFEFNQDPVVLETAFPNDLKIFWDNLHPVLPGAGALANHASSRSEHNGGSQRQGQDSH